MIDVRQAFREHEILLTGANGFLGKVLLAFLFDRCPEFKHLHILMRPGGGWSGSERFWSETMASPVLQPVAARAGHNQLRSKVSVWEGDIAMPGCGLSQEARHSLERRADLIINCAGKVDFFPPLDDSFKSNVDGVEEVVAIAGSLGAKLLHVSTSYVCGEADGLIEETEPITGFYPRRRTPEDDTFRHADEIRHVRELVRQIYDSAIGNGADRPARRPRELAQRLVALGKQRAGRWGWVNTYTYSKSLGEQIIASTPGLDYAIVRPAIVESSWQFPFPGWIEGGRTAAPLVLMALDGLKDWPVCDDAPLEVVPVDMAAAAILIVAALLLDNSHEPVYQVGSADVNPIELGSVVRLLHRESLKRAGKNGGGARPPRLAQWLPGRRRGVRARFISAEEAYEKRRKFQNAVARTERWVGGMKSLMEKTGLPGRQRLEDWTTELRRLRIQSRFREQTLEQYLPFVLHNRYIFESENIRTALSSLSESDRKLFPWIPERIDWRYYWINNQIAGIERWVQPEAVRDWTFQI